MSNLESKKIEQAKGIFKDLPNQKELFLNNRGEFFTNENLCRNSVKKDADYSRVERSQIITEKAPVAEKTEEEKESEAKALAEKEANKKLKEEAEAKAKEEALKSVEGVTTESLKAKGESLEAFLAEMKRAELDALEGLFDFSISELPNKAECVKQIVEALA